MIDENRLTKLVKAVRQHGDSWRIFFEDYGEKTIPTDNDDTLYWWKISTEEFPIDDTNVNGKWWVGLSPEDREEYRRHVLHYRIVRKLTVYKDIPEKEELIKKQNTKEGVEEGEYKVIKENIGTSGKCGNTGTHRDVESTNLPDLPVIKEGEEKNGYRVHRKYEQDDTVLNEILRSERWTKHTESKEYKKWGRLYRKRDALQDRFGEISRSYRASLALYKIVNQMRESDDTWVKFMKECCKLKERIKPGGYGLTTDKDANDSKRVDYVFCIPHTTRNRENRDDSILSLAARRNPPLKVVEVILTLCRKSISHVDDPQWDCIPLNYAIINGASPKVVEALIPNRNDCADFPSLRDFDFLNSRNVHYRTTLHCAAYYDAPIETIKVLRKECDEDVLSKLDHCQLTPLETAIWHGRSTQVIKEFFITGLKGSNAFEDVLAKLIRSMIYNKSPFEKSSNHDPLCQTLNDTFDANPIASELKRMQSVGLYLNSDMQSKLPPPSPIDDRNGAKGDQYPLEYGRKATTANDYDVPSLSTSISESKNLQNILSDKASHRFPTFVKLADLYVSIILIVSYKYCARHVFETGNDIKSTFSAYALIGAAMFMTFREFLEFMINDVKWLLSPWNYLDLATIGLVFYSFDRMWNLNPSDIQPDTDSRSIFGHVTIVTTLFIWLEFIVILRSTFKPFAILVSGTIKIGTALLPFMIWCFLILSAFGQMLTLKSLYKNSCESEASIDGRTLAVNIGRDQDQAEPDFCTLKGSTLGTFSYFIGILEYESLNNNTFIICCIWLVGILILQNIVIAIVTQAWIEIVDISKEVFWDHRLSFLMSVKDYEKVFTCGYKYNLSSLRKYNLSSLRRFCTFKSKDKEVSVKYKEGSHDVVSKWLKCLWPGNYYVGDYESMFERVFSTGVGSLRWQIVYDCRTRGEKHDWFSFILSRIGAVIKTLLLLIIVFIVMAVLFIIGLVTLGLLWPQQYRTFLFGSGWGVHEENIESKLELALKELLREHDSNNLNEKQLSRKATDISNNRPSSDRPSSAISHSSALSMDTSANSISLNDQIPYTYKY